MSKSAGRTATVVYAAGGVVWRETPAGDVEVALVHRPRYDDWTLPKGKVEPGETLISAAVREIGEETGYQVQLGRHLRRVSYDLRGPGRKHVHYWSAEVTAGSFVPNHEVDELRWLSADSAEDMLSYRLDRQVLGTFRKLPARLDVLLLVRHAKAGRKSRYHGDDRLRPLDKVGRAQAEALLSQLLAFGPTAVHSADRVRCSQTVAPLADELGVVIEDEPTLSEEAFADDAKSGRRRIRDIGQATGTHVVCSQGKVIPPLLKWWAAHDELKLPAARNRKGSFWVLALLDGKLVAASHVDSPLASSDH
ncbi:bifunctional NUDIX hydrolase/histidine phosphatase family protein [Williamsia sp. 1135]|uniref:NUDIX hydrolase n=1 Tax=Williamsia sp. 1135 TaxID=1889262 RepID=UPI000A0FD90C|nr:bifunctional NUDIX hydrolase/histidine phosphatase family protein [Williamsia sp. 1135]ORM29144.1 NUDIX hydrolase [Williamsia sp. 1135]